MIILSEGALPNLSHFLSVPQKVKNDPHPRHPSANPKNLSMLPHVAKGTLQVRLRILRCEIILDNQDGP